MLVCIYNDLSLMNTVCTNILIPMPILAIALGLTKLCVINRLCTCEYLQLQTVLSHVTSLQSASMAPANANLVSWAMERFVMVRFIPQLHELRDSQKHMLKVRVPSEAAKFSLEKNPSGELYPCFLFSHLEVWIGNPLSGHYWARRKCPD